jgi:hypothetical protein
MTSSQWPEMEFGDIVVRHCSRVLGKNHGTCASVIPPFQGTII